MKRELDQKPDITMLLFLAAIDMAMEESVSKHICSCKTQRYKKKKMRPHFLLCVTSLLAGTATASFDGNINYDSPSRRHESLGIDVGLVESRSWKRGNVAHEPSQLHFTHDIASGDPCCPSQRV